MADSSHLRHVVEPFIVAWVSQRIGIALKPRQVIVGPRSDGTPVRFAFDGVSECGTVGLLVSTSLTLKSGGERKLHKDASILLNAPFERRIMTFISDETRVNFLNKCDGLLPLRRIEMFVCDSLPAEMRLAVEEFQVAARAEVGDKGKKWKPGGLRR